MSNQTVYCGLLSECVPDIVAELSFARHSGFDFLVTPLSHPRYKRTLYQSTFSQPSSPSPAPLFIPQRNEAFTRSDMLMSSGDWSTIVGMVSNWIELDSEVSSIRRNSEMVYKQEMSWASHLSLSAVLLPTLSSHKCVNFARCLNETVFAGSHLHFWLPIPLSSFYDEESDELTQENDPWEWWNRMRLLCDHHVNLSPVIELTENLPPHRRILQWLGEPLKAVIIPTDLFTTNKKGYPVLSNAHREFVQALFKYNIEVVIKGSSSSWSNDNVGQYKDYIQWLYSKAPQHTEQEAFEAPYRDYLQVPLQPLMDNLESQTYEVFEKDPVKYRQYEEAVYLALMDRKDQQSAEKPLILMVLGAGRGPLVRASLQAAKRANSNIKLYAVEKNPNALVTLKNMHTDLGWGENVFIVDSDMRVWNAPEKADIIVSELLGSFGDNELSPECLDGAQKFLKDTAISIPCSYTSYLAPISSSKLFNEVKSFNQASHFETAYVVKVHNIHQLAESKECFTFVHPNPHYNQLTSHNPAIVNQLIDNNRYKVLEFVAEESSTLHGLVGYFDSKLYKDVHISINPANFSDGMFSWFPLYFPFKQPVYVEKNSVIEVHMWRIVGPKKVWYEWSLVRPVPIPIHNVNGRSYWIGL